MIHFSRVKDGTPHCGTTLKKHDELRHIDDADLKVGDKVCTKCLGLFYEHSVPMAEVLVAGILTVTPKGLHADQG